MLKIKDMELYLNNIIEVITNDGKVMKITVGRLYKWNRNAIYLDISDDLESLDKVQIIKIKDIFKIRKINYHMWR